MWDKVSFYLHVFGLLNIVPWWVEQVPKKVFSLVIPVFLLNIFFSKKTEKLALELQWIIKFIRYPNYLYGLFSLKLYNLNYITISHLKNFYSHVNYCLLSFISQSQSDKTDLTWSIHLYLMGFNNVNWF